jgi:CRP/FNR family transcriptional regulator, cyclic AMP receptor protein
METIEPLLAAHPFLKGLDQKHLKLIVGCASNMVFNPGQYIFRESEEANSFYFIRKGRITVETYSALHGPITIQTRTEGEILGWSWLVPPYRWHFDARATEQTRVVALDGKCLREKCEHDHDLGYELMKRFALIIAERLEATRLQLLDVYGK